MSPTYMTFEDLKKALEESGRGYNMENITAAYNLANEAHADQKRRSGEPYISHPLNVAKLLVELGMDSESVEAGLLHDVVEDTSVDLSTIESKFGPGVMRLVDGVTKLTKMQFSSVEEQRAESIRKMLLAMSQDVRVMIIKLCDRLHNMRTGDAWPEQKRRDKALETMEVYAPIAHRLGISNIKEELEDRSLQFLDPVGYAEIRSLLDQKNGEEFLKNISAVIQKHLEENGIHDAHMKSRVKSVYGIYRKTFVQNRSFDEIYDIYAVRIILDTVAECYNALGVIHDMFHPIPNRFKDYISTPKPNMYQSLHTTVIGHEGIPFEVQIRTKEMDQMAEYGVAAHWKYKEGIQGKNPLEERLAWVRQLLESQRDSADAGDLLRDIKSDLLPEEVFAFTPKGDVINLPAGASVIDFAYAIHSAVGNRMVGAKVNSHIVPIDHKVVTGEIIEILTGPADKGPSRDWLKLAATSQAKNKIRAWFKKERREENIQQGKEAFEREMRRNFINLPLEKLEGFVTELARRNRMNTPDEMYAAIGYGGLQMSRVSAKMKEEYAKLQAAEPKPVSIEEVPVKRHHSSEGVIVEGIDNGPVKFAKCCSPLPGDEIVGFITRGFGVSIHKRDCANVQASMKDPENAKRWVKASWEDSVQEQFNATLEITALNRDGLLGDITLAFSDMRVPIYAMNARQVENHKAVMNITFGTANTEHLNNVIARLRRIRDVISVTRN